MSAAELSTPENDIHTEDAHTKDGTGKSRETVNTEADESPVNYSLRDIPPVPVLLSSAIQHLLMCLPTSLVFSFIVADTICLPFDSPVRAQLFSAELFLCGVSTLLQTFLGVRLPILQGPSAAFLPTILSLQKNSIWTCPDPSKNDVNTTVSDDNASNTVLEKSLSVEEKLQQLSGSLMAASAFEILIGATGLVGLLMRFMGPITVAATVILLGVSLTRVPITYSKSSWELALGGAVLAILFSLYLRHKQLPVPSCRKQEQGKKTRFPFFQMFPILLSVGVVWIISAILTATNVFPDDTSNPRYKARTDAKNNLLHLTPWFQLSYPGQFGIPSFNVAIFIGFLTAFCASIVESVGDYLATARACHVPSPPNHAVSRGILMEGIGALMSGAVGVGHATTSLSQNVAVVALSGTCSRAVLLCAGFILVLISVVGKLGAAVATIPDPALGGVLIILFGMLVSLGLSNLQYVKMDSSRNVIVLGISLFVGILLPEWVNGEGGINTGNQEVDGVLKIALGTPMFVGGLLCLILDNTVKGSLEERGVRRIPTADYVFGEEVRTDAYSWSCLYRVSPRLGWCHVLPFMPPKDAQLVE